MNDAQLLRYSRHILLDEMGVEAQERLLAATVLVVGASYSGTELAVQLRALADSAAKQMGTPEA